MSRRRTRLVFLIAAGVGVALLAGATAAQASGILGSGIGPDVGPSLNPLPSIGELLSKVVNGLFGALLSALTPGFLRHADIHTLEWLVALPNVADTSVWPTVGRLEANMVWVAGAILPTTLIIATARDTALSLTFRAHPGNALLRATGAVFWLVLYRFSFKEGVAFVNILTHTMLSWPIVSQGLHRTVLVMFGSSVIFGVGGAFLGLLGFIALILAISLFGLKVFLLVVLAVLFVGGPLVIAFSPAPVIGYLVRGWLLAVAGICLIPVGWCIIFSTAGAISLDVTNLGGGAHIGSRVVGAFAALVTFYVAWKWPLMVLGHVRNALGGLGVRPGGASGGGGTVSNGALAAKAQRARTGLQAAMLAGGRGLGLAAGQLGVPRGGLVGLAGRQARPHVAAAVASGAIAVGPPRLRPRPTPDAERVARAGDKLRETPSRMREAWRAAGEAPSPGAPARRGGSGAVRGGVGAGASPGGKPRKASRGGGRRSGSSRGPSRAGGPGPGPRKGGSSGPARAARKGSAGSKRPPVVPPARPVQGGAPGPRGASSGRDGQSGRGGVARAQASAAARPQSGGRGQADSPRPAQRPGSSGQRRRPAASGSRSARPPGQPRKGRPSRAPGPPRPVRKGRKG
jgi:hypothetical protein